MELETLPAYERDPRQVRLETEVLETGEQDGRPYVVLTDTVIALAAFEGPSPSTVMNLRKKSRSARRRNPTSTGTGWFAEAE